MSLRMAAIVSLACLFVAGSAWATPLSASIVDSMGDPSSVEVVASPADVPITIQIYLTTTFAAGNAELKLESLDGNGIFKLTGVTYDTVAGWGYSALSFSNPDQLTRSPGGHSSQLLGCLSMGTSVPAGTSRLATVNAVVRAGTPEGDYRLSLNSILAAEPAPNFTEYNGVAGTAYTVHVVPEPSALALLGLAGLLVGRRRA